MEFVKFPNLQENKKEIFSYVKQDFPCKDRIYVYPLTNTTGIAYCGKPIISELTIPVVIKRLLKQEFPFGFFFTIEESEKNNEKLFGAVVSNGKNLESFLVPYEEKAMKSVILYVLKKGENLKDFQVFYLGSEELQAILKKLIAGSKYENIPFRRMKPKPLTEEEINHLITEPSWTEYLKELYDNAKNFYKRRLSPFKEKILTLLLMLITGTAGYIGYYHYKWEHKKEQKIQTHKQRTIPKFLLQRKNLQAYKVISQLFKKAGKCAVTYNSKSVVALGNCSWIKGKGIVFVNGRPVKAVYPIKIQGNSQKEKPTPWETVLSSYNISGNYKKFIFKANSIEKLKPLFNVNRKIKVTIIKEGKEYQVEVESGNNAKIKHSNR